jgi:hypothetical protein
MLLPRQQRQGINPRGHTQTHHFLTMHSRLAHEALYTMCIGAPWYGHNTQFKPITSLHVYWANKNVFFGETLGEKDIFHNYICTFPFIHHWKTPLTKCASLLLDINEKMEIPMDIYGSFGLGRWNHSILTHAPFTSMCGSFYHNAEYLTWATSTSYILFLLGNITSRSIIALNHIH